MLPAREAARPSEPKAAGCGAAGCFGAAGAVAAGGGGGGGVRAGGAAVGGGGGVGRAGAAAGGGGGGGCFAAGGGAAAGGGGAGRGAAAGGGGGGGGAGRGAAAGGGGGAGAGRGGAAAGGGRWRRRRCWSLGRGGRRRSARRWPLGPTVRASLFLGLGNDQRCGLRMRCGGRKLRYRQRCCGKQHDAKVCHDVLGPRKNPGSNEFALIDALDDSQQVIIRPECGCLQMARRNLFHQANGLRGPLFIACSDDGLNAGPVRLPYRSPDWARVDHSARAPAVRLASCPAAPAVAEAGLVRASVAAPPGEGSPGAASGGGSVGCPGVAGGISGGSIGITSRPCGFRRCPAACRSRRLRPSSHS